MSLVFSNGPIVHQNITVSSVAGFITQLAPILVSAGWLSLGGGQFKFTSPQGGSAILKMWDPADSLYPDCVAFQLTDGSGSNASTVHKIQAVYSGFESLHTHSIWVNVCSLFISGEPADGLLPGFPRSLQCGIPWSDRTYSQFYWISSEDSNTGFVIPGTNAGCPSFRSEFYCMRYDLCYIDALTTRVYSFKPPGPFPIPGYYGPINFETLLMLGILRPSGYVGNGSEFPAGLRNANASSAYASPPFVCDPLLIENGVILGQLYDVCCPTCNYALNQTEVIWDSKAHIKSTWINYMSPNAGSHALITDGAVCAILLFTGFGGFGNFAY